MLLTRSSLCVTLAVKWLCYRSARAVTHPMRRIVCALSRLYYLLVRLGEVAVAGGQVHRAVHVAVQRKRGVGRQRFCCTLSQGFAVRDGKQQDDAREGFEVSSSAKACLAPNMLVMSEDGTFNQFHFSLQFPQFHVKTGAFIAVSPFGGLLDWHLQTQICLYVFILFAFPGSIEGQGSNQQDFDNSASDVSQAFSSIATNRIFHY